MTTARLEYQRRSYFTGAAAAFLILVGGVVAAGWRLKSIALVTLIPGGAPIALSTAIALVVLGCSLLAMRWGRMRMGGVGGLLLILLGTASLLQFFRGWNFGFDESSIQQRQQADFSGAQRMTPNIAASLIACGAALFLLGSKRLWSRTVVLLISITIAISFLALCGSLAGLRNAYGWSRYTGMAFPTCIGFLLTGLAVLWHVFHRPDEAIDIARGSWPFFSFAGALIFVVGAVSLISSFLQSETDAWVYHTYRVRDALTALGIDLTEAWKSDTRAYYRTGDADPLGDFGAAAGKAVAHVEMIGRLTSDNPAQQARMGGLRAGVQAELLFLRKILSEQLRSPAGFDRRLEEFERGNRLSGAVGEMIHSMTAEEQRLLKLRMAAVAYSAHQTREVIALAGVLAVALFWAAIERNRRAQREASRAEAVARESQRRLDLALDSGRLGAWDLDWAKQTVVRSLRHDQIFGYEALRPEWSPEIFFRHVLPEDREQAQQCFVRALATDKFSMECRVVWPDESLHWIAVVGRVFRGDQGQPVRLIGVISDISELKVLQQQLVERNTALEIETRRAMEANRLKSEFLANMSHELRTPLNGIIGFSEFLVDQKPGPLNPQQTEYLNDVLNSGRHLLQLINNLLDLAKIEAGFMELLPESFPLREAVAEVSGVLRPLLEAKAIDYAATVDLKDDTVFLDPQKIKQVLYNLLSNAIKFTPEGGVVELRVRAAGEGEIELEVRDSGIGIAPEEIGMLFKEFQQLDSGASRRYQGTGLGLVLTKRIVEMHGGSIHLESEPGKGSTFTVILPKMFAKTEATT